MSLDTYANLKTEIPDWLGRTDLTSAVDTFIDLCESKLNQKLRTRNQETVTTLAVTSEFTDLPADFLGLRHVAVSDSPDTPLTYLAPEAFVQRLDANSGTPKFYTILANQIRVAPVGSCTLDIVYFAKITALSDSNTTNFVLTNYPELYLYGSLSQAEAYIQNDPRIALWKQLFEEGVNSVTEQDKAGRYGGPMAVRVA